MGKVRITVDGAGRMKREFERDFSRALSEMAGRLADSAVDKSRDVISVENRIFTTDVYRKFRIATTRDGKFEQSRKVHNTSAHSDAVDRGVPAAAYADGGPPVQALLPWVKAKMGGWSLDYDEDGGGEDPDPPEPLTVGENTPTGPDYNKIKRIPEGAIIRGKHARGFNRGMARDNLNAQGIQVGWNGSNTIVSPQSDFLYYRQTGPNSYELIENSTSSEITFYIPNDDENILGFRQGYDTNDDFDYFVEDDLPDKYTTDFPYVNWRNGEDWNNKVGKTFYFRDGSGIVGEYEVTLYDQGEVSLRRVSDGYQVTFTPQRFRDYPDDTRTELIAVNEGNSDNLEISEILDGVDTTDVFGTDDIYLSDMRQLRRNLNAKYGDAANSIYKSVDQWKQGSNPKNPRVAGYANSMKSVFDIEADSRGGVSDLDVTNDTEDVLLTLKRLSDDFLKENYSDGDGKVRAFRTMQGRAGGSLSKQIWENPRNEEWTVETNAVQNYTTTKSNVNSIRGPLTESTNLDIEDDVLISVDALMHLPDSNLEREGEIHVRGGRPYSYDRNDLEFNSKNYSDSVDFLADQFFEKGSFSSFTDDQMLAISSTVKEMGERDIELDGDDAKDRLNAFVDDLVDRGLVSDDEKWENWASMITGEANTLEFDGYKRVYDDGWYTYEPGVETATIEDLYTTQRVEVFNINTEEFSKGEVSVVGTGGDSTFVTIDGDNVHSEVDSSGADYLIVGARSMEDIPELEKDKAIKETIDLIRTGIDIDTARANKIKQIFKDRVLPGMKDKELLKNHLQKTNRIRKLDSSKSSIGSHGSSNGEYNMNFKDSAGIGTILHEPAHGTHKEMGYTSNRYPNSSNTGTYYDNLFDDSGDRLDGSTLYKLNDSLLGDNGDIPGAEDDGSFPDVLIERREKIGNLDFESVSDSPSEIWNRDTREVTEGDFIEIETNNFDGKVEIGEIEETEFDGEVALRHTVYPRDPSSSSFEIWTDTDGNYVNMVGVSVKSYAERQATDSNVPKVELNADTARERSIEAMNLGWMEMILQASRYKADNGQVRYGDVDIPTRAYSSRAANEMFTTFTELMQSNIDDYSSPSWANRRQIELIDERYPYMIEGWLEIHNPSDQVKTVLEDLGYEV